MFSVVMPVWNKRPYLADAVAGVLAQNWRNFELIAVDDGSTDGSLDLLRTFTDPRLRIIAQANAGPGRARNRGIEAARHGWIAFLDADDLWLPDHLAELDIVRCRHPGAGLIGTAFTLCGRDGAVAVPAANGRSVGEIDYFSAEMALCASSAAIPRSTYCALGGFGDRVPGQDSEYWARIALERPVAISSRVTAVYRLGTGGISDTARSLWYGQELRRPRDLGPSVALLLDRYAGIRSAAMRASVDRYIDSRFRLCVRRSARIGDLATLRAVPKLFLRPPEPAERIILAAARLPGPLAAALYAAGFGCKALARALARLRPPGGRAGAAEAAFGRIEPGLEPLAE